eukprot:c12526_g1_i1.p1 GENE.c12526_g1_i1~~c12526_g1_i1.p1  ORF type:complete len:130 (+),score=51.27 c12526_g1_i1:28-417(+)
METDPPMTRFVTPDDIALSSCLDELDNVGERKSLSDSNSKPPRPGAHVEFQQMMNHRLPFSQETEQVFAQPRPTAFVSVPPTTTVDPKPIVGVSGVDEATTLAEQEKLADEKSGKQHIQSSNSAFTQPS